MLRKLLRLANPEIAFGFLIATVFWMGVLGWQAAYAPSEMEKRQCEETAHKSGHKTEECKTIWERTTSDPVAFFTFWLVVFTAVLGGSTVMLWLAGEKQIELSRQTSAAQSRDMERAMIAANRPWISVDIRVAGPIFYNVNGANITLRYVMKNIGRSPATNVMASPRLIAPILSGDLSRNFDPRAELRKEITEHKSMPPMSFGFSLFPEETIAQDITVSMANEEIKRATVEIGAIYPTIIGSVSYRMGFDDTAHQTGFIVEVRRNDAPRPSTTEKNRSPAAIWVDEGDVPAVDVRLFRTFVDGGYAD